MDSTKKTMIDYRYMSNVKYFSAVVAAYVASLLSVMGSLTIIYIVLRKKRTGGLYHRILLGLSASDLISSTATMFQLFLIPSVTGLPAAIGSFRSCEAVAFFFMYSVTSYLYNSILSVFFYTTIRCGWSEKRVVKLMEPWIHVLAWLPSTVFGILGVTLDSFNPNFVLGACVLDSFPADCTVSDEIDCIRGDPSTVGKITAAFDVVVIASVLVGITCTWLVYRAVRRQTIRNTRYSVTQQADAHQLKRTRAVALQAMCYTAAFLNSFLMTLFGSIVSYNLVQRPEDFATLNSRPIVFVGVFLLYAFNPCQGFLNGLIYIRPDLVRWKEAHPHKSWWWALCRTVQAGNQRTPSTRMTMVSDRLSSRRMKNPSLAPNSETFNNKQGNNGNAAADDDDDELIGSSSNNKVGEDDFLNSSVGGDGSLNEESKEEPDDVDV